MTLVDKLRQSLTSLPLFSGGDLLLELSEGSCNLRCELIALDSLACAFMSIVVRFDALAGLSGDQLKRVAVLLSNRLTYLLEPISLIEIDAEGCVVQMRSAPPHRDSDRTNYYELLVARSGELSLRRYSRSAGQPREAVAAHVTREVFARLVSDLSAVS